MQEWKMYALNSLAACVVLLLASVAPAQEVSPPQDSGKYYMYVFTHADWRNRPDEARLMQNLSQEPLATLRSKCNFKHYTESEPVYAAGRYWNVPVSDFPAIIISDPRGAYFYSAYKSNIPPTAQGVFDEAKKFYLINKSAHETSPAPPKTPETDQRKPVFPNAPWNNQDQADGGIEGLFWSGNPILQTAAWSGWVVTGLIFLFVLFLIICVAAPFGLIALYLVSKLFK